MELDLQSIFGLHVHSCAHWLRPRNTRAQLVSQYRRHLFVTPCLKLSDFQCVWNYRIVRLSFLPCIACLVTVLLHNGQPIITLTCNVNGANILDVSITAVKENRN